MIESIKPKSSLVEKKLCDKVVEAEGEEVVLPFKKAEALKEEKTSKNCHGLMEKKEESYRYSLVWLLGHRSQS